MKILSNTLTPFVDSYTTSHGRRKHFVADIEGEVKVVVGMEEVVTWGGIEAVTAIDKMGAASTTLSDYIDAASSELRNERPKGITAIQSWMVKICIWSGEAQGWVVALGVRHFEAEE